MGDMEPDERDFFTEALEELAQIDGSHAPAFVQVPDGFYTRRAVIDGPITAQWCGEAAELPAHEIPWHVEDCEPIVRFRTELHWLKVRSG